VASANAAIASALSTFTGIVSALEAAETELTEAAEAAALQVAYHRQVADDALSGAASARTAADKIRSLLS
jgi:hypothetical protein